MVNHEEGGIRIIEIVTTKDLCDRTVCVWPLWSPARTKQIESGDQREVSI